VTSPAGAAAAPRAGALYSRPKARHSALSPGR
jgi:hypothetical protein